jgi:dipeptidyl-peptidase-4
MAVATCASWIVGAALLAAAGDEPKRLSLEQTMGPSRVSFTAQPRAFSFARDGVHLATEKDGKTVWIHPTTKAEREPTSDAPATAAIAEADLVAALAKLPGFDEAAAKRVASTRRGAAREAAAVLLDADGELYFFRSGGEKAVRLTFTPETEENGRLSPDGRLASHVRANDLYLVETETGRERRVTKDGGPDRLNGKLDWVYQEEVYGRGNFQACWWSPTSRHLAFLSLDETGVPVHPIVDHIPDRAELEETRYPKSGDPNPKADLCIVRARDGRVVRADLSRYAGTEPLVVRVGWTPDGSKVCFQVQDREQTWLDLCTADPDSGAIETLLHETTNSWVNVLLDEPRWLADGTFLWLSEKSGFKHLYRHDAAGKELAALTSGE